MGQVRGRRGGRREQVVKAARRHPVAPLPVRAPEHDPQRHHLPRHVGLLPRGYLRPGDSQKNFFIFRILQIFVLS